MPNQKYRIPKYFLLFLQFEIPCSIFDIPIKMLNALNLTALLATLRYDFRLCLQDIKYQLIPASSLYIMISGFPSSIGFIVLNSALKCGVELWATKASVSLYFS